MAEPAPGSAPAPGPAPGSVPAPGPLEATLRAKLARSQKCLVPYITAGIDGWLETVHAVIAAGADAVEIGLPFSDPVMDGPTIQQASDLALSRGTTAASVMSEVANSDLGAATPDPGAANSAPGAANSAPGAANSAPGVPLVAMTYYNIAYRMGHERFANSLKTAGFSAAILADLPADEAEPWTQAARESELETVFLAAPTSSVKRCEMIAEKSRGFIYAVGLLGVTGEREQLAASANVIARRLKEVTDKPVLVGVGISTPENAVKAAAQSDGVVVGSALVRTLLDTGSPEAVGDMVGDFRQALDEAYGEQDSR